MPSSDPAFAKKLLDHGQIPIEIHYRGASHGPDHDAAREHRRGQRDRRRAQILERAAARRRRRWIGGSLLVLGILIGVVASPAWWWGHEQGLVQGRWVVVDVAMIVLAGAGIAGCGLACLPGRRRSPTAAEPAAADGFSERSHGAPSAARLDSRP